MTKNEVYALETEVCKNIERIKREQAEYVKGVEAGIELMAKAVRARLAKEEETAAKKGGLHTPPEWSVQLCHDGRREPHR